MREHARVDDLGVANLQILPTITDSTRGWPHLGLPTLLTAGEREQGGVQIETQARKSFMHQCVCSNQCNKKGGWCVRAVVTVAPHCTAGQDR